MKFKLKNILIILIQLINLCLLNVCHSKGTDTLDLVKSIESFNMKDSIAVDINRSDKIEKLFICDFPVEKNVIDVLSNFLKRHKLKNEFVTNSIDKVIAQSVSMVIDDIAQYYNINEVIKTFKTTRIIVSELGIYSNISLIKNHIIFYLVINVPYYNNYEHQFDLAVNQNGEILILNDLEKLENSEQEKVNPAIERFNSFVKLYKLQINAENISDFIKVFSRSRPYANRSHIKRTFAVLSENDLEKINSSNFNKSEQKDTKEETISSFVSCMNNNFFNLQINKSNDSYEVEYILYEKKMSYWVLSEYLIYRMKLLLKYNGEILSVSKEILTCKRSD